MKNFKIMNYLWGIQINASGGQENVIEFPVA